MLPTGKTVYYLYRPYARGVLKTTDTTSRIIRLEQKLADLDYEMIYKKGMDNKCADFLSRNPHLPRVMN